MEVDVLGVRHVRRSRKAPSRRIHRPERGELLPAAPEVIAVEQVSGLGAGEDADARTESGAREAVHVLLAEALVSPFPGAAAITAREHRALLHSREDRAAVRLDQEGVHVLVGQSPIGNVPARARRIPLDAHHTLDRADQDVSGRCGRTIHRGSAMREGDRHERLLVSRLTKTVRPGASRVKTGRIESAHRAK